MKWSLKLGRYAGIEVYAHFTFLLFLLFVALASGMASQSMAGAIDGALFFGAAFLCVILHEFGHALMARRFGVRTRDIILLPIGGVARLERIPDRPGQELWITLAGPAVNVVIAIGLLVWLWVRGFLEALTHLSLTEGSLAPRLLLVNVALVVFNMIPAFPMDGGRILRALLAMHMDYARATRIAAALGRGFGLVFVLLGVLGLMAGWGSPMLLFIGLFVWIGASHESRMVQRRAALAGTRPPVGVDGRFQPRERSGQAPWGDEPPRLVPPVLVRTPFTNPPLLSADSLPKHRP